MQPYAEHCTDGEAANQPTPFFAGPLLDEHGCCRCYADCKNESCCSEVNERQQTGTNGDDHVPHTPPSVCVHSAVDRVHERNGQ